MSLSFCVQTVPSTGKTNMTELDEQKLFKRFLYISTEESKYVVPKKEDAHTIYSTSIFLKFVTEGKVKNLMETIESANKDILCVNRSMLIFVLAYCAHADDNVNLKTESYNTVLKVCKTHEELLTFLKYSSIFTKNFSHGFRRIIQEYYLKKKPSGLFGRLTNNTSFFGWSHADIIKMSHLKPTNLVQEILFTYTLKNLEEAKKKIVDNKQVTKEVEQILLKLDNLQVFKHCQDENQAANMIRVYGYTLQQLPGQFHKSQVVWDNLIPLMEIPALLKELARLNKLGFLKTNSTTVSKVVIVLTDVAKCNACKIYPAEVLINMKTYERGKPVDPKLKAYLKTLPIKKEDNSTITEGSEKTKREETNVFKNSAIISAFNKLLQCSYRNQFATGKRMMITMDVRDPLMSKMCFQTKTVTALEAASVIAMSFFKSEKDVTIAVFNGDNVNIIQLAKGMTLNQAHQKLKQSNSDYVLFSKPFQWATEKNKHIDVFINMIYHGDSLRRIPKEKRNSENVFTSLKKYKKKMKLINTKLVTISLGSKNLKIADGTKGILDICGFDETVPKILQAYCKESFY